MALEEGSVTFLILKEWVPPVITILLGGFFASMLIPRWQDGHARFHAREARRLALAEELAQNFTRYTSAWRRLRQISELDASRPDGLTHVEAERKIKFVEERGRCRDALWDTFCSIKLYFSRDVGSAIDKFIEWDDQCSVLTLKGLPPHGEWHAHRDEVLTKVQREIAR